MNFYSKYAEIKTRIFIFIIILKWFFLLEQVCWNNYWFDLSLDWRVRVFNLSYLILSSSIFIRIKDKRIVYSNSLLVNKIGFMLVFVVDPSNKVISKARISFFSW